MTVTVKVARTSDLPPGSGKLVEVNGQAVALFNVDGTYYAIGDTCPHAGGPLNEGELDGCTVTCPWHGAKFDVTTGQVLSPPARSDVQSYAVNVVGDDVLIEAESP